MRQNEFFSTNSQAEKVEIIERILKEGGSTGRDGISAFDELRIEIREKTKDKSLEECVEEVVRPAVEVAQRNHQIENVSWWLSLFRLCEEIQCSKAGKHVLVCTLASGISPASPDIAAHCVWFFLSSNPNLEWDSVPDRYNLPYLAEQFPLVIADAHVVRGELKEAFRVVETAWRTGKVKREDLDILTKRWRTLHTDTPYMDTFIAHLLA